MQELNGADLNGRPLMVREDREDRDVKNYQIDHARETRNEATDSGKCQVRAMPALQEECTVGADCCPRHSVQVYVARAERFLQSKGRWCSTCRYRFG